MISVLFAYAAIVALAGFVNLVRMGRAVDRAALAGMLVLCVALNPGRAAHLSVWEETMAAELRSHGVFGRPSEGEGDLVHENYGLFSLMTRSGKPVTIGALDRIVVTYRP